MAPTIALMQTEAFKKGVLIIGKSISEIWNKIPESLQLIWLLCITIGMISKTVKLIMEEINDGKEK